MVGLLAEERKALLQQTDTAHVAQMFVMEYFPQNLEDAVRDKCVPCGPIGAWEAAGVGGDVVTSRLCIP
jgi:hypothetical protein